jgi:hypothetical protein
MAVGRYPLSALAVGDDSAMPGAFLLTLTSGYSRDSVRRCTNAPQPRNARHQPRAQPCSRDQPVLEQLIRDRRSDTVDERLPHLRVLVQQTDNALLHFLALSLLGERSLRRKLFTGGGLVFLHNSSRDPVQQRILALCRCTSGPKATEPETNTTIPTRLILRTS